MRFRAAIVLAIGMAMQFTSGATLAHHSFASEFDNAVAVRVQGVVTTVEMVNPHSFIYLEVEMDGAVESWALEGPGPNQVQRRWGDPNFIKPGDTLGACGYPARSGVSPTRPEPFTARAAKKLQAAVLTMAKHGEFVWSNYRQGKCGLDKPIEVLRLGTP
jgi:hypothetical protein